MRTAVLRRTGIALAALALALAATLLPGRALAQTPTQAEDAVATTAQCLACHSSPGATRLEDGTALNLQIDGSVFAASAHAELRCVSCHAEQGAIPHTKLDVASGRDFTISMAATCAACHTEAEDEYRRNVHGVTESLGVKRAATCIDCHGSHDVRPVAAWTRDERAARCATCHQGASARFADAMIGHSEPSPSWFPILYIVERFMLVLILGALGFGTIHVELDLLRWAVNRLRGRRCPPGVRRWRREPEGTETGGPWQGF